MSSADMVVHECYQNVKEQSRGLSMKISNVMLALVIFREQMNKGYVHFDYYSMLGQCQEKSANIMYFWKI